MKNRTAGRIFDGINCSRVLLGHVIGAGLLAGVMLLAATGAGGTAAAAETNYLSDQPELILAGTQGWGELGWNVAAHPRDNPGEPLRIGDRAFSKGLGHHASGAITVALDGAFSAFDAEVGLQPCDARASVVFRVLVDGQCRFDSGVMKMADAPKPVHVPVTGATELVLDVGDAGDGIACDMANWANARLTRDPSVPAAQVAARADIAPFARVVTSDPARAHGTSASRVQEFPAEDVFLENELRASVDGTYTVPTWKDGVGCIGLRWHELRLPREVSLQFDDAAAMPAAEQIQLQQWAGESPWQGAWKPMPATARKVEDRLVWQIAPKAITGGTQKIRWIFPASAKPAVVKAFSATVAFAWKTADIRIESALPSAAKKGRVEIYNGHFVNASGGDAPSVIEWDSSKPLYAKVRYIRPQPVKVDRTVLFFALPEGSFAVAIEDVLAKDAVYVPHAGLFVTREPAPVPLADYLKRNAGRKTVLEQVREMPDQTFEQAMKVTHAPAQNLGPVLLSLAYDNRKFTAHRSGTISFVPGDAPDGDYPNLCMHADLDIPGWPQAYPADGFNYRQFIPRFGNGKNEQFERHMDGGWLPRPVIRMTDGSVVYSQRTYVSPVDRKAPADAASWQRNRAVCIAEITVENPQSHEVAATLSFELPQEGKTKAQASFEAVKGGFRVAEADRLVGLFETKAIGSLAAKVEAGRLTFSGKLPPGKSARMVVYLPAWKLNPSDYGVLLSGANWAGDMSAYWNELLGSAMRVELPDALLANIIRASQVHCILAARNEDNGRRVSAWVSSDRYGTLESESHAPIRGMDMTGVPDFARRSLDFFIHRYNTNGFLTTGYTIVGTGMHLWTLGEYFERTGDVAWLKQNAPEIARVCRWVVAQRARTKRLDLRGGKVPEYGLMTPGVSADWNRFAYRFFNEAQYCAGLDGAGRALASIGHPEAASFIADAKEYQQDIQRAYRWTQSRSPVIPLKTGAWMPYYPSLLDCFGNIDGFLPGEDENRSWAYSIELGPHHLEATGVFDPRSEEAAWQLDHMEDEQFLRAGRGEYPEDKNRADFFNFGGFAKVQPYYARVAEIYAQRDEVKPFIRAYFNGLASLVSKENLSIWEHFHSVGGWNKTHETGWFLCQSRLMLLMERGDELWLAPFVTSEWLKEGETVAVTNAPTRFGLVSYRIVSHVKDGAIEARIEPPARSAPKAIVLRLRHPDGKPMRAVTVNEKAHTDFDPIKETIRIIPKGKKPVAVRATY